MKIMFVVRKIILFVFLSLLLPLCVSSADYTKFGIIGDTAIGVSESVYKQFIAAMEKEGIQIIFHTGDTINRPGNESEIKRFLELTGNNTIHIAPGNHDINNFKSLKAYKTFMSMPPYYSFSFNDTLFIILCTDLPGETSKITGKQLDWLEEELQKSFVFKFVFLHKPLFPTFLGQGYCLDKYAEERDYLHEIFTENNVDLVVSGHEHLYNRIKKDDIAYITTGGGGSRLLAFREKE
jgi:acid phosphatase type 7